MPRHALPRRIDQITRLVGEHFTSDSEGVSLLPALVTYSIYQCLIEESIRFKNKQVSLRYTANRSRQDSIEDLVTIENNGKPFEVIVVRNRRSITAQVIKSNFSRFENTEIRHFYFLTTAKPYVRPNERVKIQDLVHRLETERNCEICIDGVLPTIKYYLRVLRDPTFFWQRYLDNQKSVSLALTDPNKTHLKRWQSILANINKQVT
jgi:DNA (cytosine-5)-methyltransferase 1